jgi:RNA polymerase sigma-70 factor, ECF subfamily
MSANCSIRRHRPENPASETIANAVGSRFYGVGKPGKLGGNTAFRSESIALPLLMVYFAPDKMALVPQEPRACDNSMDQSIHQWPATDSSLLRHLRRLQDVEAWTEFVESYGPYLQWLVGRYRAISRPDADDLVQGTFVEVVNRIGDFEYDREKGRFHKWLSTILYRNAWKFLYRKPKVDPFDDSQHPDAKAAVPGREPSQAENKGRLAVVLQRTKASVPKPLWETFELTALQGKENEEAAAIQKISVGCVYARKSRVMKVVRRIAREVEAEHE